MSLLSDSGRLFVNMIIHASLLKLKTLQSGVSSHMRHLLQSGQTCLSGFI